MYVPSPEVAGVGSDAACVLDPLLLCFLSGLDLVDSDF